MTDQRLPDGRDGRVDFLLRRQHIRIPGADPQRNDRGIRADPDFARPIDGNRFFSQRRGACQQEAQYDQQGNQFFHIQSSFPVECSTPYLTKEKKEKFPPESGN